MPRSTSKDLFNFCRTFREKVSCVMFRQLGWLPPALQTTSSVPPIFLAILPGYPPPPWLPFSGAQEPPYFPSSWRTYSPLCSPRGAFLIQSWFLPLVTDYITGARKMNWGFLSCLDLLFKMAPHLLFPHSSQAIPLSQTHVQQSLSLAPRWGSGW